MSRSGHSDKPKRSSLKKSKDLGVAAARILALLRASPTNPPSEHDLASELQRNMKSARAALAVAKVILPNWTLLWVLVETAMKDEHLAVVIKWLERMWDVVVEKKQSGRHHHGHGEVYEEGGHHGHSRRARSAEELYGRDDTYRSAEDMGRDERYRDDGREYGSSRMIEDWRGETEGSARGSERGSERHHSKKERRHRDRDVSSERGYESDERAMRRAERRRQRHEERGY